MISTTQMTSASKKGGDFKWKFAGDGAGVFADTPATAIGIWDEPNFDQSICQFFWEKTGAGLHMDCWDSFFDGKRPKIQQLIGDSWYAQKQSCNSSLFQGDEIFNECREKNSASSGCNSGGEHGHHRSSLEKKQSKMLKNREWYATGKRFFDTLPVESFAQQVPFFFSGMGLAEEWHTDSYWNLAGLPIRNMFPGCNIELGWT